MPLREDRWVWVDAILHRKSSDLWLLNAEEKVFLSATVSLLLSVVLPSCVSQYLRQYEVFEVADDTSRLLAETRPQLSPISL